MKKSMKKGLLLLAACVALGASVTAVARESSKRAYAEQAIETVVDAAVLRQGSKGGEVKEVQRRLKLWGYYDGAVDGVFGEGTAAEGYIYICPVCGNREKFVSRYCRNCGTKLSHKETKEKEKDE